MPYCTLDDLQKAMPMRTLAQLTNDQPPAIEPDMAVVQRALEVADEIIDGHLRSRYELPLQAVPTVLRDLSVNLVRHSLYARRPEGKDDLPPAVVRGYKAAMEMLGQIQRGTLSIGVAATQAGQAQPGKMRVRVSGRRQFGPDVLDRY